MSNMNEEVIDDIPISKIINSIYDLINDKKEINNLDLNQLKDELGESIINNLDVKSKNVLVTIKYKGEEIPQVSKIFEFEDINGIKEYYKIYTKEYFEKIVNKYKIKDAMIIYNNKLIEDLSFEKCLEMMNVENFKVIERKIINFEEIFKQVDKNEDKIILSHLSLNYNYYFKDSKVDDFIYSHERNSLIKKIMNNSDLIQCYCGPHGIGKTTTFLVIKKEKKNCCYFNLKLIFKNYSNALIWKDDLILKELADTFKYVSNYEKFKLIQEQLLSTNKIWNSIIKIINFVIKENIEIQFILDQYKEKLDLNFENIKTIFNLIKTEGAKVSIIILSSINDKDVRLSLLNLWFGIEKNSFLNYIYLSTLFNVKIIIEKDTSLSLKKKNMIMNEFNCIPKYYFEIKNIEDDKLEDFKNSEIINIRKKLEEFFNDNPLNSEEIILLVKYNYQFGIEIEIDKTIFEQLVNILAFKYFIFNIINFSINYYFPLIEEVFKSIISEESLKYLKRPIECFTPSIIGDLLEFNLINDLSKNKFGYFNYICKVDSIYNLKKSNYTHFEDVTNSTILFTQSNPNAKLIDFGILYKGEDLMLFQCKKALISKPKNYVKYEDIFKDQDLLSNNFEKNYKIKIKRIYLLYITGISFYKENQTKKETTWGINSKEDFDVLINICKNGKAELLYYDVINKIIYHNIGKDYLMIGNIFSYVKKLAKFVVVEKNLENENNSLHQQNINFIKNKIDNYKELIENIEDNNKSEDFFNTNEKYILSQNNFLRKYKILGKKINPNDFDLNIPVFIGFKRKGKKYLSFFNEKREKKVIEVLNDTIKEVKNYHSLFENPIQECFYFKNENEV